VEAARRKVYAGVMNRIDKTVVFKTLRDEHLAQILEIELGMVQQRVLMAAGANQFVFNCTAGVKEFLLKEGTDSTLRRAPFEAGRSSGIWCSRWPIWLLPARSSWETSWRVDMAFGYADDLRQRSGKTPWRPFCWSATERQPLICLPLARPRTAVNGRRGDLGASPSRRAISLLFGFQLLA